jgi:hypothetical protein
MSFSLVVVGLDNYHVVIFVLVAFGSAFGSAFGVAYWLVISSTSLSIAVHTREMLVSLGVGVALVFGLSLVPLVVMCCPFLLVYGCVAVGLVCVLLIVQCVVCCFVSFLVCL